MSEITDKAKDAMESAVDIARDQLDTFKKLDETKQKIVLAVLGVVLVLVLAWLFWPKAVDLTIVRDESPVGGYFVAVMNNEKFDLGKMKIIVDDNYEIQIDSPPPGEPTEPIYMTMFRPIGNPNGAPPGPKTVPKVVKVITKKGNMTKEF